MNEARPQLTSLLFLHEKSAHVSQGRFVEGVGFEPTTFGL